MDLRLKQLSYSSLLNLHKCPRKFQLLKLQSAAEDNDKDGTGSITLAYGHAVGLGIQLVLQDLTEDQVIWEMYKNWEIDLASIDEKRGKSFYLAVLAIQKFIHLRKIGLLKDYELVTYQGRPAVELSFCIRLPGGFNYRGFVDAVLQHKSTGKILVLEAKTTWFSTISSASYKNSAQAIGYSIVLDAIFPDLVSYSVQYLVYKTKALEFEPFKFDKSYLQRAQWIQELIFDVEAIEKYEAAGLYPQRGESCVDFGRECGFLNTCGLNTKFITKVLGHDEYTALEFEHEKYQIVVSLEQLIEAQLRKSDPGIQKTSSIPQEPVLTEQDEIL